MPVFTKTQYYSAYEKTPDIIKDVMASDETAENIKKISVRHNAEDKGFDIAAVLGYVMVGLIPVKKFIQELQGYSGLDPQTAKNVAHDIRAEIFAQVAEELAALQAEAEKNYEEARKHETYNMKHETKESQTSLDSPEQNKEPLNATNNNTVGDNSSTTAASADKHDQDGNAKEAPQIEYMPKKKEDDKKDESLIREHQGYPVVGNSEANLPAQKEGPENREDSQSKTKPPTPKEEPKPGAAPQRKEAPAPDADNNIKNEIFPPAPPANLPGANANSKKPLSELGGEKNNKPAGKEENKEQEKNYPPIPNTHKVDLRNNNNN